MIGTSIDNMNIAVNNLTKSLSGDLLAGFKMLTETLSTKLTVSHHSSSNHGNSTKRRRDETNSEPENKELQSTRKKKFAAASNIKPNSHAFAATSEIQNLTSKTKPNDTQPETHKRKSVVVSNIAMGITPEYLNNYLSKELEIDTSSIRTTLMNPAGITEDNVKFLQFRISVPEANYSKVRSQSTWPVGVRIRDYVFNRRGGGKTTSVSKENFLLKGASYAPFDQQTATSRMEQRTTELHMVPLHTVEVETYPTPKTAPQDMSVVMTPNLIEIEYLSESTDQVN